MKFLRWLLFPFSILYGIITFIRNKFYDLGLFSVYKIPVKSICVGNLSTGGTGKTPHVAFLAELLSKSHSVSILSRGYGRETKGFKIVELDDKSSNTGDEPMMYKTHFNSQLNVVVCEERKIGIEKILETFPQTEVVLLDDAFQHRAVDAGLNILLTDYSNPFYSDFMLPTGNLREWKRGKNRADILIITKCPAQLNDDDKTKLNKKLKFPLDQIFYSFISYHFLKKVQKEVSNPKNVLLVTGIANSNSLKIHLEKNYQLEELKFSDHHIFTKEDVAKIHRKFDTFAPGQSILVTTEKDFVRLKDLLTEENLTKYPWYIQPISVRFDNEENFKLLINNYVDTI